jgi:hypothetical protein
VLEREQVLGYPLLAPAVIYILLLIGYPFLVALWIALSDQTLSGGSAGFVGLENFEWAVDSSLFRRALTNTLIFTFTFGSEIIKAIIGTTLAFLLIRAFRGRKIARALIFIPLGDSDRHQRDRLAVDVRRALQRHQLDRRAPRALAQSAELAEWARHRLVGHHHGQRLRRFSVLGHHPHGRAFVYSAGHTRRGESRRRKLVAALPAGDGADDRADPVYRAALLARVHPHGYDRRLPADARRPGEHHPRSVVTGN